jgi:hypothetical protein
LSQGTFFDRLQRTIRLKVSRAVLTAAIPRNTKRLIVFLSPGHEFRAGGVMAIALMYQETLKLKNLHQSEVVVCTVPWEPPLLKYSWFENSGYMLDLNAVLQRCQKLDYLLLHVPDYQVNELIKWLNSRGQKRLNNVAEVHFNVMVFNIDHMMDQDVEGLKRFGKVTCTTGREAYSNLATRAALGVPLHKLEICTGPEFYSRTEYHHKEPLLVVSPDSHPMKETILQTIARALPELQIQVIQDLSYQEYKELIRRAKWALTFGEGLDGYFAEPVFSGTVAFAVFNERFFTPAYATLETVYPSWEILKETIAADLQRFDNPDAYNRCWVRAYDLLSEQLNTDRFRENLRLFYRGEYTFP